MKDMTIKEAREKAGVTQQYMADELGITRQAYAYIESHPERTRIEVARKICSILGAEYERIFFSSFAS